MKSPTMQHVRHIASNKRHQHKRVALMSILAALVVLGVVHALLLNGRAATKQEQVLSCPVTGTVAHRHDKSCYDADGNLVCKLPEVEQHVHGDSCYQEERTLVCGLAEGEGAHWHDDSCYDEAGNLVCGLDETPGHVHSDSCYQTTRTLACGKAEVTETHQHGPGCFQTIEVPAMPKQTFEHQFTDKNNKLALKVSVDAPEGALPEGTTMKAEWVPQKKLDTELIQEAVAEKTDGRINGYQAVDLTFLDAEGNEVEPAKKVTVTMTSPQIAEDVTNPVLVHVESQKEAAARAEAQGKESVEVEAQVVNPLSAKQLKKRDLADEKDQLVFDSDQFSVYAIVYTVDFHWEVDGQKYVISMPGGGFVSFQKLLEALGVAKDATDVDVEKLALAQDDAAEETLTGAEKLLSIDDVQVSELTKQFVADVESVTFSSPQLVWVGQVDEETSVGALKQTNGLDVEYSAELTESQIEQINAQTVDAGDWALISLKAFDTEEYLLVTMKNGDSFQIRVTDAQNIENLDTSGLSGYINVDMFDYYGNNSNHAYDNLDSNANHLTGSSASTGAVDDGINKGHDLKFMAYGTSGSNSVNHFTGGTTIRQGIVQSTLDGDYPKLATGSQESLRYLFEKSDGTGRLYKGRVEGLFYKANSDGSYNANGSYYAYDSDRYYAYNNNGTIEHHKADITIESTGNGQSGSTTGDGTAGDPIGFFPLDQYDGNMRCPHPRDVNWYHLSQNNHASYNHSFGLSMSGTFQIPEGRKVNGQDMIFSFSGDDDMWVFIDDVLVLDIGGIHHPSSGYIDFSANNGEGKVHVDNTVSTLTGSTAINASGDVTIKSLFDKLGKTWDNSEYSTHTIKVFYLERGGIYSNCKITFNIPLVLGAGEVTIVKKDAETGTDLTRGFIQGAEFGIWKNADCTGDPIATATSAADGKLGFSKLAIEDMDTKYYLKEITAPTGYLLSDEVYTLSVGDKSNTNNMYSFNITDSSGTSVATIGQQPALPMITNKPAKIDATKKWQQGSQDIGNTSDFKVKLMLVKKDDGRPATTDDTSNEVTQTVSGNGTASWMLKNSNVNNYTVKETAVKLPWMSDFVEIGDTNPYGGVVSETAEDGFIVTNNIPTTDLSVTKEWKDGTTEHADRVFDEAKQIGFTLYQKLDGGEPTVYTAYGTNGKGTIAYTPAAGSTAASWSEVNIQNLPTYVYDQASNQWKKATYYVVEDPNAGVNITYKKSGDQPGDSAEGAGVSADDEQRAITIVNTDLPASFELVKVEKGKPDKKIPGAVFTLRRVKATAPYDYAEDKAVTKTTDANGQITFDNLIEGYYEVKETKLPAGYINAGQEACYIKVSAGTVVLVEKDNNGWKKVASVDDGKFTYIAASEQTPAKITVENTPGAELPAAGGVGNAFTNILGAMAISAVVFTRLLRRLGAVRS